jgi:hypothetical protein
LPNRIRVEPSHLPNAARYSHPLPCGKSKVFAVNKEQ